jgi:hypothetical protein
LEEDKVKKGENKTRDHEELSRGLKVKINFKMYSNILL